MPVSHPRHYQAWTEGFIHVGRLAEPAYQYLVPVNGKRYNVEYLEEHGAGRSSVEQRYSRDPGPFQVCVAAGATDLILKLRSW